MATCCLYFVFLSALERSRCEAPRAGGLSHLRRVYSRHGARSGLGGRRGPHYLDDISIRFLSSHSTLAGTTRAHLRNERLHHRYREPAWKISFLFVNRQLIEQHNEYKFLFNKNNLLKLRSSFLLFLFLR